MSVSENDVSSPARRRIRVSHEDGERFSRPVKTPHQTYRFIHTRHLAPGVIPARGVLDRDNRVLINRSVPLRRDQIAGLHEAGIDRVLTSETTYVHPFPGTIPISAWNSMNKRVEQTLLRGDVRGVLNRSVEWKRDPLIGIVNGETNREVGVLRERCRRMRRRVRRLRRSGRNSNRMEARTRRQLESILCGNRVSPELVDTAPAVVLAPLLDLDRRRLQLVDALRVRALRTLRDKITPA